MALNKNRNTSCVQVSSSVQKAAFSLPIDADLIERLSLYTASAVNPKRYEHSVRTALTASRLCRRYGLDAQSGYFAGIVHDMCKDMDEDALFSLAVLDGHPVSGLEAEKKSLLHGRAAAVLLQKDFGVCNGDVLEAVRCHTFGKAGMGDLAKVLYIADKIEPGRAHSSEAYITQCMNLSLDTLLLAVAEENENYLKNQNKAIASDTFKMIQSLRGEIHGEL
ncbi:bis(5'-nucleosyl)-tetraphosphatase (symmetrical) YqeK [Treponema sp. OMZ 840]|uniref:bis(5'-nucleosyl)-tetraphosphatase (symmetrical) YqeK n=1 Tax=Treponema sp. OMZ 840 TaxID=244313 RepID=UPI003D9079D4